jgi:hypothetical protein
MRRILLLSTIALLSSCRNSNKSEMREHVSSALPFDTVMGISGNRFRQWDSTQQFMDSVGVKRELFYKDGKLLLERDYEKSGVLGIEKEYYANGKIRRTSFFVQNKYYGDTYVYDENGEVSYYLCYDFSQRIFRRKYYNGENRIVKNEGPTLGQVRIRSMDATWKLGEDVVIYFVRTLAPNERNDYKMFLFDKEKVCSFPFDVYKNTIVFNPRELKIGSYKVMLTVRNVDTVQNAVKADTIAVDFAIR